jgi:pyruvate/2-oxoglutarate dehydrogenase complex dihydrolipoamide acyltransferase (E2) component
MLLFAVAAFLFILPPGALAADGALDQVTTLAGVVSREGLTAAGAAVKEGDVLLRVMSIQGSAPAARATVSGRVAEVLVKAGDQVKSGQVIARIKPDK